MKTGTAATPVREPMVAPSTGVKPTTALRNDVDDAVDFGPPETSSYPQSQTDASTQHQEIELRAYELYVEGGFRNGRAEEDWLNAEREICGRK